MYVKVMNLLKKKKRKEKSELPFRWGLITFKKKVLSGAFGKKNNLLGLYGAHRTPGTSNDQDADFK